MPFAARWHFIPHDYWRFTPSGLERLLSAAGFTRMSGLRPGKCRDGGLLQGDGPVPSALDAPEEETQGSAVMQAAGLVTLPLVILLAAIANLSLGARGGTIAWATRQSQCGRRGQNDHREQEPIGEKG